jgi:SAM-dependent methyltransferase
MKEVDRAALFGERPSGVSERIAPGFFPAQFEAEHLERYWWSARWGRGLKVLDVACGTGYGAEILRRAGARLVVSVDVSFEALRFGKASYGLIPLLADGHRLPLRPSEFDLAVSLETIEHMEDPELFAEELARVLKPGGILLLSTPNSLLTLKTNPYHLREFTLAELRALLDRAGFRVQRAWGQRWEPPALYQKMRGLRRLGWEFKRRHSVIRWAPPGSRPLYWCVKALRRP